ncbi:MAG: CDP-alcohol phosphatidyltransferase family protein [Desulfurococcales archaeon]|nr:CDP-alcohol phosphatidyltransferase family protein [Desulfurococcales archaeon]
MQKSLSALAKALGGRVNANVITVLSPFIAAFVPLLVYYGRYVLAFIFILIAGFLDILDGAVARETGQSSRQGAFLDSMMDRFVDTIYYTSLVLAGYNAVLTILSLGFTITITYAKARVGSLGGVLDHRILERSDRIIIISMLILLAGYIGPGWKLVLIMLYAIGLFTAAVYAVVKGFKALGRA